LANQERLTFSRAAASLGVSRRKFGVERSWVGPPPVGAGRCEVRRFMFPLICPLVWSVKAAQRDKPRGEGNVRIVEVGATMVRASYITSAISDYFLQEKHTYNYIGVMILFHTGEKYLELDRQYQIISYRKKTPRIR
jgi:hypothetical protein